jgi:hypothetical protein
VEAGIRIISNLPFSEDSMLLDRNCVHLTTVLGAGWFGDVAAGVVVRHPMDEGEPVVAQILREGSSFAERAAFAEAARGAKLASGPNVLRLLGTCADTEPHLNVFETCQHGNLRVYVSQTEPKELIESGHLLKFCLEAARGLAALLEVGVAPHDLATRTCQLASGLTVRVGDYGLAATGFPEDYVPVRGEGRPVRWTPPEVLEVLAAASNDDSSDSASDSSSSSSNQDDQEVLQA